VVAALVGGAALPPAATASARKLNPHVHHAKKRVNHPKMPGPKPRTSTTAPQSSSRTVPAVCPNAQASAATTTPPVLRAAIVCLVNQQRAGRALPQLTENPLLDTSAQFWTDTMVVTQVFSHGTNFIQRLASVGYDWSNSGENIATGYETPHQVIVAWMASTEHCQNILNPNYANIGVGVNPSPVGTNVADAATWTQDFGLTMVAPYPSSNTAPMTGCPYTVS
jgi:uncharacterized protein YkwD